MYKFILQLIRQVLAFVKTKGREKYTYADVSEAQVRELLVLRRMILVGKPIRVDLKSVKDLKYYPKKAISRSTEQKYVRTEIIREFDYRFWVFSRELKSLIWLLHRRLTKQTSSAIKQWNDALGYSVTFLFGLSNAHSATIFSAIFGTSSFRIHA